MALEGNILQQKLRKCEKGPFVDKKNHVNIITIVVVLYATECDETHVQHDCSA